MEVMDKMEQQTAQMSETKQETKSRAKSTSQCCRDLWGFQLWIRAFGDEDGQGRRQSWGQEIRPEIHWAGRPKPVPCRKPGASGKLAKHYSLVEGRSEEVCYNCTQERAQAREGTSFERN